MDSKEFNELGEAVLIERMVDLAPIEDHMEFWIVEFSDGSRTFRWIKSEGY